MNKNELVVSKIIDLTSSGKITWKVSDEKSDHDKIDVYNKEELYRVFYFTGYKATISNQSIFCLTESPQMNSINTTVALYITNANGEIATKITREDLPQTSGLKLLPSIIKRSIKNGDAAIDNLLNNLK